MQPRSDHHLFITSGSDLLPRWVAAFPQARLLRPGEEPGAGAAPSMVWLHLRHGIAAADQIATLPARLRAAPLVLLSDLPDDEEALAGFTAGARGYVNTHAAPLLLRRVAAVVQEGGLWIGEALMQRLLRATSALAAVDASRIAAATGPAAAAPLQRPAPIEVVPGRAGAPAARSATPDWSQLLTERERQVALRVAQGDSNKEVARSLGLSESTVKAHLGAVLEKLHVRDRLQLSLVVNGQMQIVER